MVVAIPLVATVSLALVLHSAVVLSLSRPRIISSLHRFLGFSLVWARKHDGDLNQDGSASSTLMWAPSNLELEGITPILSNLFHSSPLENHDPDRAELVPDTIC